ncbi:hypothetical protein [Paracoccus salsus]|uniref:hypothetical protein n=1 Tax=Paracoccus salsus TaxID=2911061 RepID=UPI001F32D814|nr:hypothetical protein [Paracoccus salsus]MCF3973935.1 hypothetical protein [Paracoccus salsus]
MLYIDGYMSLRDFVSRSRQLIIRGLLRWEKDLVATHEDVDPGGSQVCGKATSFGAFGPEVNIFGASTHLAWLTLTRQRVPLTILTPHGGLVKLSPSSVELSLRPIYEHNAAGGIPWDWYWEMTAETFHSDGWQEMFANNILFEPIATAREPEVCIDWNNGLVAVRDIIPENIVFNGLNYDLRRLAALKPYNGCSVLVPDDIGSAFRKESWEQEVPQRNYMGAPHKKILNYSDDNPRSPKKTIKEKLFPKMSARQFEMHWTMARSEKPELGRPGRRSVEAPPS